VHALKNQMCCVQMLIVYSASFTLQPGGSRLKIFAAAAAAVLARRGQLSARGTTTSLTLPGGSGWGVKLL
jgi:hypothetical protein